MAEDPWNSLARSLRCSCLGSSARGGQVGVSFLLGHARTPASTTSPRYIIRTASVRVTKHQHSTAQHSVVVPSIPSSNTPLPSPRRSSRNQTLPPQKQKKKTLPPQACSASPPRNLPPIPAIALRASLAADVPARPPALQRRGRARLRSLRWGVRWTA